jgi:hypothetical protein
MANMMELNKAAQARSDQASQAARKACRHEMLKGGLNRWAAIQNAAVFEPNRTAMYTDRFNQNGDESALIDGICAIHGAIARSCLERKESPDNSPLIAGGTFGGIG